MKTLIALFGVVLALGGAIVSGLRAYDQITANQKSISDLGKQVYRQNRLIMTICVRVHEDPGPCFEDREGGTR